MTTVSGKAPSRGLLTTASAPAPEGRSRSRASEREWDSGRAGGWSGLRVFIGSRLLLCVLAAQAAFVLALTAWLHVLVPRVQEPAVLTGVLASLAAGMILVAGWAAARSTRVHREERDRNNLTSSLMDTVLDTSQEWLWAVDAGGIFTFCSRASAALLGYEPSELLGRPFSLIITDDHLSTAREAVASALNDSPVWSAVTVCCRHRNGTPVLMEMSGKSCPSREGTGQRFEGTSRLLPAPDAEAHVAQRLRERIGTVADGLILTAFQPIHDLTSGAMTGVEALARFPSDDGRSPEHWFSEAASVGLGADLELAALAAALCKSATLPGHLYVSFNVAPETCMDPRLPALLRRSGVALERVVLELTERHAVTDYAQLLASLAPLRRDGVRIAVDDAGSGFASMRHILQLSPDIIKLDRTLIAGIDRDQGQRALGAAMVSFAQQTGAQVLAEGIETIAELLTVTQAGITSAQGYLLGRPTLHPSDWAGWREGPTGDADNHP
ncbi:EAL domain-containing protein [Arthrobacter sp. SAFR-179]|uniref:sensor domain-containing phosphodiesterase n=1 Tax=Arthrobacter sp. SAFR-179 TaxID=3387279 RepID=UPI003F7B84AD